MRAVWPTEEELGSYHRLFLGYWMTYLLAKEFFQGEGWLGQLEGEVLRYATMEDGTVDMLAFFEAFHLGLPFFNWEASRFLVTYQWF
jgi:hypothetical protein